MSETSDVIKSCNEIEQMDIVYIEIIDDYKNEFRRVELELVKEIKTIPPRHIVYRETFFQNCINQYEYDCLMDWEDEFATSEYKERLRTIRKNIKNPKIVDNAVLEFKRDE